MSVIALSVDIRQSTVWEEITKRKPDAETRQRLLSFNDDFITRVRKLAVETKCRARRENLRPSWELEAKRMVTKDLTSDVLQLTASCYLTSEHGDLQVTNTGFFFNAVGNKLYFVRSSDGSLGKYKLEPLLECQE